MMRKRSTIWLFLLIVFLAPFLAYAIYSFYARHVEKLPVYGKEVIENGITVQHRIAGFELLDQEGIKYGTNEWKEKIVIANFFFTHCPIICPKMTRNLKKVQAAFRSEDILINSFTIDPERDSVAQLQHYTAKFGINGANWKLLTGDKSEIYKLARNSFMIVATDGDGGPDDFIHSEKLVLLDKQRRIRGYYDGTSEKETDQLIHDIKRLLDEN